MTHIWQYQQRRFSKRKQRWGPLKHCLLTAALASALLLAAIGGALQPLLHDETKAPAGADVRHHVDGLEA